MSEKSLKMWEAEFRSAAAKDKLALLRDHLQNLELADEPESLLEGTILLVQACRGYASIDGQLYDGFLRMQKYRPTTITDAKYTFTFDLCGKAYARVLVPADLRTIDLADLYGHPWADLGVAGYRCFWVSRTDGTPLSDEESEQIENAVTDDLRFDYSEDELSFWFDTSPVEGVLLVTVQEIYSQDQRYFHDE